MAEELTVDQMARITNEFVLGMPNTVDHPDAEGYRERLAKLMGEARKYHPEPELVIPPDFPD